jgi:hypothetical protein
MYDLHLDRLFHQIIEP